MELFGLLGHLELNVSDWPVRLPLSHSSIAGRTADANLHLASAFHQRADATADVGQAMALRKKSASFYVRACRVLDAIAEALLEPRQEPPPPPPPLQLPLSAARAAAHSGLAVVRQQLGELNEALEEYLLALEIFTSYIDVHVTQRIQQPSTQAAAAAAADPSSPSPSLPLSAAAAAAAAATAVSETPAVTVMSSDGSRNLSSVITVAETHLEIARIYIALGSEQVEQLGPHSVAERKLLRGAVRHYRLAVGAFEAEHGLQHGVNPEHARPRPPSGLPLFTRVLFCTPINQACLLCRASCVPPVLQRSQQTCCMRWLAATRSRATAPTLRSASSGRQQAASVSRPRERRTVTWKLPWSFTARVPSATKKRAAMPSVSQKWLRVLPAKSFSPFLSSHSVL